MPPNFHKIFNPLPRIFSRTANASAKKLLIYLDQGVSSYSAYSCLSRFQHLLKPSLVSVSFISSHAIKNENWEQNTLALVIPGGRSKPYYLSLGEQGNQRIMEYVNAGGSYLGLCAGAYYASKKTQFEIGSPLELQLECGLNFFQGTAIGPAYGGGQYSYYTLQGARAARIVWTSQELLSPGNEGFAYYNGGCYFSNNSNEPFEVLARYSDIHTSPAAVIESKVGSGKIILSGVHFEANPHLLRFYPSLHFKPNFIDNLIQNENYQNAILCSILNRMGIPANSFSPGLFSKESENGPEIFSQHPR
ncbi:MAG: hypothetical protein H0U75_07265 [Legionella sp.]|nr:hypothetical protein [Legionella sp.]